MARVEDKVGTLVMQADAAWSAGRWDDLAASARQLAPMVPARLGVLAAQVHDLVDEGDGALAAAVWSHVSDALRFELARKPSLASGSHTVV